MKKIRILIVDDHQLILDGLKSFISNVAGFAFAGEAMSGAAALSLARSAAFDIVLMDIEMEGINGIETTRQLIAEKPDTKIIALTMYNEKGMITKALEAGASGYVLKNSNKDELIEAILKVASGEKHLSGEVAATMNEKKSTMIRSEKESPDTNNLTKREIEILRLIAQGLSNREVGEKLFISHRTVDTHRTNMMEKLEIKNIAGLIRYAIQQNYL
ncbi:MAG: response regulator [Bacteroidia bacterium]